MPCYQSANTNTLFRRIKGMYQHGHSLRQVCDFSFLTNIITITQLIYYPPYTRAISHSKSKISLKVRVRKILTSLHIWEKSVRNQSKQMVILHILWQRHWVTHDDVPSSALLFNLISAIH